MKGRLIFFSFMSAILFLCSCNTPKKLSNTDTTRKDNTESKKPSKDPDKPKEDSSKIVNDPRSIPEKPIEQRPRQEEPFKRLKKENINVVLALPMDGGYEVNRFAELINGFGLASESLSPGKLKIKVEVINIGNTNSEEDLLNRSAIERADILIGGYQTSQVKTLAKIALDKKIPFISIWNTSEEIITNNPYYVQLKPSLDTYCKSIAEYVSSEFRPQMVFIMIENRNSKDNNTLEAFKLIYDGSRTPYKIIYTSENNTDWKNSLAGLNNVVFNIPNWENKNWVSSILNQINSLKKNKSFIVTGMPQWIEWDQMNFNIYEQLSLHVPVFNYVDMESMNASLFNESYYNKYNTWPTTESFYGSDILNMVRKISTDLSEGLVFNPNNQISGNYFSNYQISNYTKPTLETNNSESSYSHNVYITIEKFEGGRFVQVK